MSQNSLSLSNFDLPILQKLAEAYKLWHNAWPHLPRLSRYTIGQKIDTRFTDLIELLIAAGYAPRERKGTLVQDACTTLDALKYFLQLAWELKLLDHKAYAAIGTPLLEVGKMLGGWRKQLST